MAKTIRELIFVKTTGALIGEITAEMDRTVMDFSQFHTKSVEIDEEIGQYWCGDYSTGSVQSRFEKPVIVESQVKYYTNLKALEQYPIHKQLNVIIDMLDKSGLQKTEEFVKMKEFLESVRDEHQEKIVAYSSNPDVYTWVSIEDEHLEASKKSV